VKRKIALYVNDILEAMDNAEAFINDIDYNSFFSDKKTNFAVIRCIEIIGEATKNIPDEIRVKYPEIPWRKMAGMRDKIAHVYFDVDFKKVWSVVTNDIPPLKPLLKRVFEDLKKLESQ
jgi:uncharacterized protein with HEPN domain